MRIVLIGWGSLVWRPEGDRSSGQLPVQIIGDWNYGGPVLPLEFSRVSKNLILTLALDLKNGSRCETCYAHSAFSNLDQAMENLRQREGTRLGKIHSLRRDEAHRNDIEEVVQLWLKDSGFDAAVWTGLEPNFLEKKGQPFSVEAAVEHIASLGSANQLAAYTYVTRAPHTIITAFRKELLWPEAVAVHEAGHFVVAVCLNRCVQRLSRVKVDDLPGQPPTIGCRYSSDKFDAVGRILCDLAGARAQILFASETIAPKLTTELKSLLLPSNKEYLYGLNRWREDFGEILQRLKQPGWKFGDGINDDTKTVLERCDVHLREFLKKKSVRLAIDVTASTLLRRPIIIEDALEDIRTCVASILPHQDMQDVYPTDLAPNI